MKLFQLNLLSVLLFLALLIIVVFVPSFVIQSLWNSLYAANIERDLSIELWQAALLWGAILTALYMSGVFQFKLDFKTLDSIDLDTIADPELRAEIERLKNQAQAKEEKEQEDDK